MESKLTGKALQGLTFLEGASNALSVGFRVSVLVYCCGSLSKAQLSLECLLEFALQTSDLSQPQACSIKLSK